MNSHQFLADSLSDRNTLPPPSPALAMVLCARARMLCQETKMAVIAR
jgi:hypothetical protein